MKIFQFRGDYPNFGDELNSWLWPKLLPDFFDENENELFIGIGSTIGDAPPTPVRKIVCGAGYVPQYHAEPNVHDGSWQFLFVRGPRTAARFGLPPEMAISDSGILLRTQVDLSKKTAEVVSFMPHWESMQRGNWERTCKLANIQLIDPRWPVEEVIAALLRSKLVIAEAMHGAIIADAFRIPWVPVLPLNAVHRDKWYDWSESLGLVLQPQRLWPSSLTELSKAALAKEVTGTETGTTTAPVQAASKLSRIKQAVEKLPLAPLVNAGLSFAAAQRLKQLRHAPSCLSADAVMEDVTARMLQKVEQLRSMKRAAA